MRVSALVVTSDEELATFRRKRLGHLSTVDTDRLKLVRDFVREVAANLGELDEDETWERMAKAAQILGVVAGDDVASEPLDEATEERPPPSANGPASGSGAETLDKAADDGPPSGPKPGAPPPSSPDIASPPSVPGPPASSALSSGPSLSSPPPAPPPPMRTPAAVPPPPPLASPVAPPGGASGASPWSRSAPEPPRPSPPRINPPAPSPPERKAPPVELPSFDVQGDDDEVTMLEPVDVVGALENLAGTLDGSSPMHTKASPHVALPFRSSQRNVPRPDRSEVDLKAGLPFGGNHAPPVGASSSAENAPAQKAPAQAPPESSPNPMSLEEYAELCLITREYPAYADQARQRFGLDDSTGQAALDRYFQQRFTDNPADQQEFYAAYERVRQRFAGRG